MLELRYNPGITSEEQEFLLIQPCCPAVGVQVKKAASSEVGRCTGYAITVKAQVYHGASAYHLQFRPRCDLGGVKVL